MRPLTLTIAALGGQGGGVVSDWMIDVAQREHYLVQATSVPGVAQRTGATIYYLEFFPESAVTPGDPPPVLALMPHPGDVDLVVASELAESGRAILRGIVTPDRTTLVASTHRSYTISEKSDLADGRADSEALLENARRQSKRLIAYDMDALAQEHRSVISAVILGAIDGSGVLPFRSESYEAAIQSAGIVVERSLAAYRASVATARGGERSAVAMSAVPQTTSSSPPRRPELQRLIDRIDAEFAAQDRSLLRQSVARLVDYQDVEYANQYLDRLATVATGDLSADGTLLQSVARGLALWMSFEDTIRVADLKTRGERVVTIRAETRADPKHVVNVTEFLKPRLEEICGTLPARVGRAALASRRARVFLGRFIGKREITTTTVSGYLLLRGVARLKRWRRTTLRFQEENERIEQWLATILSMSRSNAALALEIAECQTLIKGSGDTHALGFGNYEKILAAARRITGQADAARRVREWRTLALGSDESSALDRELQSVLSVGMAIND